MQILPAAFVLLVVIGQVSTKGCPSLKHLQHVTKRCISGNKFFKLYCTLSCDDGFKLPKGYARSSVCRCRNGKCKWNIKLRSCVGSASSRVSPTKRMVKTTTKAIPKTRPTTTEIPITQRPKTTITATSLSNSALSKATTTEIYKTRSSADQTVPTSSISSASLVTTKSDTTEQSSPAFIKATTQTKNKTTLDSISRAVSTTVLATYALTTTVQTTSNTATTTSSTPTPTEATTTNPTAAAAPPPSTTKLITTPIPTTARKITTPTTTTTSTTTTKKATTTTVPTTTSTRALITRRIPSLRERCAGKRGRLPKSSKEIKLNFKRSTDKTKYNYNELLHMSILFYESQRSGYNAVDNRVPWRGDSGLHDGCDVNHDLTGGWYDAGDHIKFGFPMASTATVLAWGMIMFKDAYVDAGEWNNALSMLKWATDYFIKAHTAPNELYGQVGKGSLDHKEWSRPEEMTAHRPSYKITTRKPGSDLAGETAAAMAAGSIVFKDRYPTYSRLLLRHARELYRFADKYRGKYDISIPDAEEYYPSYDYKDEIVWACLWLYQASKDAKLLRECKQRYNQFGMYYVASEFSWSLKTAGIQVLMANITRERKYRTVSENFVRFCKNKVPRTPGGMTFFLEWGSNRYAANAAFIALATAASMPTRRTTEFVGFAREQIYKLLGDGDGRRSYVTGFGRNPPTHAHQRGSSCPKWTRYNYRKCRWADFSRRGRNPHTLYGALVGGPLANGRFEDVRDNYKKNEVATDYNAGFQSAIAGLKYFVIRSRETRIQESNQPTLYINANKTKYEEL